MEQIHLSYGLSKEIVKAIMILDSNTLIKVHLTNRNTNFIDNTASVQQGDT